MQDESVFGGRLGKIRDNSGISQQKMAKECDVSRNTIQNYEERNTLNKSLEIIQTYKKKCNSSYSYIIDGEKESVEEFNILYNSLSFMHKHTVMDLMKFLKAQEK